MTQASRFLTTTLLCIFIALGAAAQEASFLIERIEIRGMRFGSESVVRNETLLTTGRTYTESELQQALARVNRLPFVLDSSFSLEKGSDRGAYVLVITVRETKPLFVSAESVSSYDADNVYPGWSTQEDVRAGARWFLGSSSMVHASTDFDNNYEAGFTQFNLFRRAGYVTLNVRFTTNDIDTEINDPFGGLGLTRIRGDVDPSPEIRFGIPVVGNHSIQGQWSYNNADFTVETPVDTNKYEQNSTAAELAWVFDTTDDPVLPARGTLWRTAAGIQDATNTVFAVLQTGSEAMELDSSARRISTEVTQYRPINEDVSVLYGGGGGYQQYDFETPLDLTDRSNESWGFYPAVGLTSTLWPDRLTRRFGDLRMETRAAYFFSEGDDFSDGRQFRATAAIVQRNVWGTLRLNFIYVDTDYDTSRFDE
jgi:outer membrane protein assembly factor BamA